MERTVTCNLSFETYQRAAEMCRDSGRTISDLVTEALWRQSAFEGSLKLTLDELNAEVQEA